MAEGYPLSNAQRIFIATLSAGIGEDDIDKKIDLIWEKDKKYVKLNKTDIFINLSDSELLELASLGYVEIYLSSTPRAIVFKRSILQPKNDLDNSKGNSSETPSPIRVLDVDIIQVYVWLGASLVFAIIAIILLVVTVEGIMTRRISTTVATGIITLVTTIASAVFFRNYDKSNDRLKRFRSDRSEKRR